MEQSNTASHIARLLSELPPIEDMGLQRIVEKILDGSGDAPRQDDAVAEGLVRISEAIARRGVVAETARQYRGHFEQFRKFADEHGEDPYRPSQRFIMGYLEHLVAPVTRNDQGRPVEISASHEIPRKHLASIQWVLKGEGTCPPLDRARRFCEALKGAEQPQRRRPNTLNSEELSRLVGDHTPTEEQSLTILVGWILHAGLDLDQLGHLAADQVSADPHTDTLHLGPSGLSVSGLGLSTPQPWNSPVAAWKAAQAAVGSTPSAGFRMDERDAGRRLTLLTKAAAAANEAQTHPELAALLGDRTMTAACRLARTLAHLDHKLVAWLRDRAFVLFGREFAGRTEELCRLHVSWLTPVDGNLGVDVPKSKRNQQGGEVERLLVGHHDDPLLCGVCAMVEWLVISGRCTLDQPAGGGRNLPRIPVEPTDVTGYVFPRRNGTEGAPRTWEARIARRAAAAGLEGITPGSLRRSAATEMAEAGEPWSVIGKRLRHRTLQSTGRYIIADHLHNSDVLGRIPGIGPAASEAA